LAKSDDVLGFVAICNAVGRRMVTIDGSILRGHPDEGGVGTVADKTNWIVHTNLRGQTVIKGEKPARFVANCKEDLYGQQVKITFDRDNRDMVPEIMKPVVGKLDPVGRQAIFGVIERDALRDKRKRENFGAFRNSK
jgi:hypothetical protein